MKIDLTDVTYLIPVRLDSIVRLENLMLTVELLLKNFETNIMILESTVYSNGIIQKLLENTVDYIFIEDKDMIFYRTKYLNMMTMRAKTPYIGIWDTDVIVPENQMLDSIEKLRQGFEIVYPYDGHFYDTSSVIRELYAQNKNIQFLLKNIDKMNLIYGDQMKGGAMFVNRASYIKAGMENEKFYGWGPEDFERYDRWTILGLKIYQCAGPLFHLTHSRGSNSAFRSMEQAIKSNKELALTRFSSKEELLREISNSAHDHP